MIYRDVEFFNVSELESAEGFNGVLLQRFPGTVRQSLGHSGNTRGWFAAQASTGCEIRFVTESRAVRITLSAIKYDGDVIVYHGDYFHSVHRLRAGVVETLHLEKHERFFQIRPDILQTGRFSPDVWRIMFSRAYNPEGNYTAGFHRLDCAGYSFRPPEKEEVPALRWIAYGSSITHGSGAITHHNAYIQHAARHLGVDVMNKGLGGSCFCEKEVCDYLIEEGSWDFATLELGINMLGSFSAEEFESRAKYLIKNMLAKNPGKQVFVITIFPSYAAYPAGEEGPLALANRNFNGILRGVCSDEKNGGLHLIEGKDMLNDFSMLACDLIHPSDFGHERMGQKLSAMMKGRSSIDVPSAY